MLPPERSFELARLVFAGGVLVFGALLYGLNACDDGAFRAFLVRLPYSDPPRGMSYGAAIAWSDSNIPDNVLDISGLTEAELFAPLRPGQPLFDACGEMPSALRELKIEIAVKFGAAIGVTVMTAPRDDAFATCIDQRVRAMRWRPIVRTEKGWIRWAR